MIVHWRSQSLKAEFEDENFLKSTYGNNIVKKVAKRINQLESFPTYADLPGSTGKHSIGGKKSFKYFTVDLSEKGRGNLRIAFIPVGDFDPANQRTITEIKILKITDETH